MEQVDGDTSIDDLQTQPIDGTARDGKLEQVDGALRDDDELQLQSKYGATRRQVKVETRDVKAAETLPMKLSEKRKSLDEVEKPRKKKKVLTAKQKKENREKWVSFIVQTEQDYVRLLQIGIGAYLGSDVKVVSYENLLSVHEF